MFFMKSEHSKNFFYFTYCHQHIDAQLLDPYFLVIQKDSQWMSMDSSLSSYPEPFLLAFICVYINQQI